MRAPLLILLLALALLPALGGMAEAQPASARTVGPHALLERWDAETAGIERELQSPDSTDLDFARLRSELEEQAAELPAMVEAAERIAQPIREQIEALGPEPADGATEAESVAAERERLNSELNEAEALIARLNQAKVRSETLIAELIDRRRQIFTERLMTPGPSPLNPSTIANGLRALNRVGGVIAAETQFRLRDRDFGAEALAQVGGALILLIGILYLLRTFRMMALLRLGRLIGPDTTRARRVAVGVALTLVRVVAPSAAIFVLLVGAAASGLFGPGGLKLLVMLGVAVVLFVAAWALSLAFFAPGNRKLRLSALDDEAAGRAHRWVVTLAGLVALDRALVKGGEEIGVAIEGLTLLNAILITLGGVALWQVIRQIARREPAIPVQQPDTEDEPVEEPPSDDVGMVTALAAVARLLGRLSAVAAPLLALAGYFAASRYAFYPLVFSGAVICLCLLLYQVVQAGVEQVASTEPAGGEAAKGRLRLIPVLVGFLLTCAALPVLAMIWGASVNDLGLIWRRLIEGIQLGDMRLSPTVFVTFLGVFFVGYLITRLIQSVLGRSVLPLTNLDSGGRDAIRAGVGYLGVTLAALAAIASAGIDLSNLAIALGALSVGIGFGLQNVVNNFVSGIILLVERPIKPGDWVELGSGMGYVKQINVRSTEIETFDRSSLIVPNSELISSPVINWTHSNSNGRIIVPVGVAYGTDPRKVEKILTEIAKAHPMLLRRPAPYVLFRRFGPDALEFEIRGVLRDVNWVLNTTSDLNYEIAGRFATEGIEIPFAQRDLHLKNVDELGQAIGRNIERDAPPVGRRGRRAKGDGQRQPEPEADPEPEDALDAGEADSIPLLAPADPSARGLARGRRRGATRSGEPEPPWATLEKLGEQQDDAAASAAEDGGKAADPAAEAQRTIRRGAAGAGDGADGDGR